MSRGPVVLKLGGSVITDKDRPETIDYASLDRAAGAVAAADTNGLILVHGGGSFGHPAAANHGISTEQGSYDAAGIRAVHAAMCRLNDAVLTALGDRDAHAQQIVIRGEITDLLGLELESLLNESFVPVLHGDVIAHDGRGVTVVSGDELVVTVARALDATRVGLCSAVPGVLDGDGQVIGQITSYEAVADVLVSEDSTDVTGGMDGKVRALLELDVPAAVFDLEALEPFLAGQAVGTTIDGSGAG